MYVCYMCLCVPFICMMYYTLAVCNIISPIVHTKCVNGIYIVHKAGGC